VWLGESLGEAPVGCGEVEIPGWWRKIAGSGNLGTAPELDFLFLTNVAGKRTRINFCRGQQRMRDATESPMLAKMSQTAPEAAPKEF
jgi:hypothetical protein